MTETAKIIVTRPKGSWRWQDAFALATYEREPGRKWRFVERSAKFASTKATADLFARYPRGRAGLPK